MNDTVTIFCAFSFVCRAQLWADSLGVPYSAQAIEHLIWKAVCSKHFSEADFTSPLCIRLNRLVVSTFCATSSHTYSAPLSFKCTLTLYSFESEIVCMFVIFFSGHKDNRCLATAILVRGQWPLQQLHWCHTFSWLWKAFVLPSFQYQ